MIQHRSYLTVADNTGAKTVMCIRVNGGYQKRYATVGDVITCVVKDARPRCQVKRADIVYAVVVRTRKEKRRSDGSYIRFGDNAAVIINKKDNEPRGSRVFGPIAREVKDRGFAKIASLAPEVV